VLEDGMSLIDAAGILGVVLILVGYAGAQIGRLEPREAPSLLLNLAGAGLILGSLVFRFNLAAFLMEAAWALVALAGLVRLALRSKRGRSRGTTGPPSRRPGA
jgi:hypothetical protein